MYILAGTKCGDVYELIIPDEKELKNTTKDNRDLVKLRSSAQDQEVPRCVGFSGNSELIYMISKQGYFTVWQFKILKKVHDVHYNLPTQSMIVFKKSQIVIVAFLQKIQFIDCNDAYSVLGKATKICSANIQDIKLSFNEEILAVALSPKQDQNARIDIFRVSDGEELFAPYKSIENLTNNIEFIDFSTDNYYMLYKDIQEEETIFNLVSFKQQNNLNKFAFDIEWCSDGIKIHKKTKGLLQFYSEENKILKMQKLDEAHIAVTD